jgi:hypothetical protein
MIFINLLFSLLLISLLYFFLFTYGAFVCEISKKFFITEKEDYILIYPLIGFAVLAIIANYLYFLFNFKLNQVLIFFLIIFFIIFINLDKKKFFLNFSKVFWLIFPILFLSLFFILIKGEQFYIFRGNYWDNMNYISQAILIRDFSFDSILNIKVTKNFIDNSYYQNGTGAIDARPLTTFFLAIIFKFKLINFFYLNNLFKIFLLSLIFLSFYFLLETIKFEYKYFLSIIFIFSFWIIYIFEIEALSHLNAIPFFLGAFVFILKSKNKNIFFNNFNALLFLLINISFFLFYPELFSIYALILIFYFSFRFKLLLFYKDNLFVLIALLFLFLIITLPSYSFTYKHLFNVVKIANGGNDFWGYYSQFFIGRDNSFVTNENIYLIKNLYQNSRNSFLIFNRLIQIFLENNFYFLPLNFIPSFFGLYYLTLSKLSSYYDVLLLFLILLLNLYLINIFIRNVKYVLYNSSNLIFLLRSILIVFIMISFFLILKSSYWSFTKLYTYFGVFFFILISIKEFEKKNYKFNKINYIYVFLLILFPFYKYSIDNNGIGYYDTFPSVIKPKYKKEIIWSTINNPTLDYCGKVRVDMKDPIINGYLSIKLIYFGYDYTDPFTYKFISMGDNSKKNINCRVVLQESKFKFIKDD